MWEKPWSVGEVAGADLPGKSKRDLLLTTRFQPVDSYFKGLAIQGVRFVITDRNSFDSTRFGLEIGYALQKLYPGKLDWDVNRFLIGNKAVLQEEKDGTDPRSIVQNMDDSVKEFGTRRSKYLLYK